jgi:hypothetical protein
LQQDQFELLWDIMAHPEAILSKWNRLSFQFGALSGQLVPTPFSIDPFQLLLNILVMWNADPFAEGYFWHFLRVCLALKFTQVRITTAEAFKVTLHNRQCKIVIMIVI